MKAETAVVFFFFFYLAHRSLKAQRWAYSIARHPSSVRRQHFQTSSPLKPLGQLKPYFMWSLSWLGQRKFVHLTKMAVTSIYGKHPSNICFSRDLENWFVALRTPAYHSLYKWWPYVDLICNKVSIGVLCFYMWKCLSSGFLRNYLSLKYNTWFMLNLVSRGRSWTFFKVTVILPSFNILFSDISSETTDRLKSKLM